MISFNQLTYLRNMIGQLRALRVPPAEVHVVDNASVLPPLLDYLSELEIQGYPVHRMPRNLGPRVVFDPDSGLTLPPVFAVTDPDLQFHADMPSTFRRDMLEIARWCGTWKCGCALAIDDEDELLTGPYIHGRTIREWEGRYWTEPVAGCPPGAREPIDFVYRALVDTTFAVYVDARPRDPRTLQFYEAVRAAGPYQARHLPWYVITFAPPSPTSPSAPPEAARFGDGRVMVRPGPCEFDRYYNQAKGSTTVRLMPAPEASYLEVVRPEDGYAFAVARQSAHAGWWDREFAAGWNASTFRILRACTTSRRGPTRLLDIGASFGKVALWAALRCEHVYCVEPDPRALGELYGNIAINRFEHCVTVVPYALVDEHRAGGDPDLRVITLEALCRRYRVPLESDNLFVRCDVGGSEELLLPELLTFVGSHDNAVSALLVTMHRQRWSSPTSLAHTVSCARLSSARGWFALSAELCPLDSPGDIARYVDANPRASVLWVKGELPQSVAPE